ncbi:cGMP-dependent protein kinase, isozyme 1-like [Bacillus rossius redtenbacheri]|uniref:cGMP-dependent protein kinase, isozyme 1-like n=1 Tax=Bacillus rossius redtenbacheri TaxID=93214 RepID=UPI002FDD3D0A
MKCICLSPLFSKTGKLIFSKKGTINSSVCEDGSFKQGAYRQNEETRSPISRRPYTYGGKTSEVVVNTHQKDKRSEDLIRDTIKRNNILKNLESLEINIIVGAMYSKKYDKNTFIINEGEIGNYMYVSGEGEFEVLKQGKFVRSFGPGLVFGEFAIIYDKPRNASIRASTDALAWVLDSRVYKQIMRQRSSNKVAYLRGVALLERLSDQSLAEMADLLSVKYYDAGDRIVEEGTQGDAFYIISGGSVRVTKRNPGSSAELEVGVLEAGSYFGELALLGHERRQATVTALPPGVECLVLAREPFQRLLGGIEGLKSKTYPTVDPLPETPREAAEGRAQVRLQNLRRVGVLGGGAFGRVDLVQDRASRSTYALKRLSKHLVVSQRLQTFVYNEKHVMLACASCPFVPRLYETYKDSKYIYFLMEPCLGGDVITLLQERRRFEDHVARFITGCVVEAIDFLHNKGIVYRDLKPENLLLDSRGYIKMADFGFAKRIGTSGKTWTMVGTTEYFAPEIVLNKGHNRAVDYWTLGILIFELLDGRTPFAAPDPMDVCSRILTGIDAVGFPAHVSPRARSLVRQLCRRVPAERLGYQGRGVADIRQHGWFQALRWDALRRKDITSPIVRRVKSNTDMKYFQAYDPNEEAALDETSGWDEDF